MTRRMADSINPLDCPPGFDLYGGYDDGAWPDAAAIAARFPGKTVIRFTVNPADNEGDCIDVENGDANPQQAPGWIVRRRQAGHGGPLVYCSEAVWPTVRACFNQQDVSEPSYFIAGYPGSVGPNLYPGPCVGHQWIDRGPYDESVVVDYLPGIDPAPTSAPSTPSHEEIIMGLPTGCTDRGAVACQIRDWWNTYRADAMTAQWQQVCLNYFYMDPSQSAFGIAGLGGNPDALLAFIVDGARRGGTVRPEFASAV